MYCDISQCIISINTKQILVASWCQSEVQQLNNAPVYMYGLYNIELYYTMQ